MPAAAQRKKSKVKPNYAGMTKEQVRALKKEKRQRRDWEKYKTKLLKDRDEVTALFHNSYYWNSFIHHDASKDKPNDPNHVTSPKVGDQYDSQQVSVSAGQTVNMNQNQKLHL